MHSLIAMHQAWLSSWFALLPCRRGKRLKRLVKILCGKKSQEPLVKLKLQTWCLIGMLMAVHLAAFILMLNLITKQETLAYSINAAGEAPLLQPALACSAHCRSGCTGRWCLQTGMVLGDRIAGGRGIQDVCSCS